MKSKIWLDIEQLSSTDDSGMFGQIAEGLNHANIVIICLSKEYAQSKNCEMEAQFALRTLNKKCIVVEVGTGNSADQDAWKASAIGLLLHSEERTPLYSCKNQKEQNQCVEKIYQRILQLEQPIPGIPASLSNQTTPAIQQVVKKASFWSKLRKGYSAANKAKKIY